jgi:iron complex outermembrane receptor protein
MLLRNRLAAHFLVSAPLALSQAILLSLAPTAWADTTTPDSAAAAPAQAAPAATPDVGTKKDKGDEKDKKPETLEGVTVTGKFIDTGAHSAAKQDLDVRDTPYTVASYTDAFMKAIETTNIADLYSYMTGISRGGATGYDISIRGFKTTQSDENAIMVDGLPGLSSRFGSPPTVAADHIEVVKGPASVLYGEAQPGGFVNIISKKPQDTAAGYIDLLASGYQGDGLSLGNTNGINGDLDLTGPLDDQRHVLYRVVAEFTNRDTFRNGWERSNYVAPSVKWNLNDSTSATLSAEYRKRTVAYDNFLVAPNKDYRLIAPITTRYQEPGDVQQEKGHSTTLAIEHQFDNEATWNFAVRSVRGEDTAKGYDNVAVLADNVTLQRRARQQQNYRSYDYVDTNFDIPFNTGPVSHKLLAGVGGGVNTTDFERIQFFNGATTGPLAKPGPNSLNINIYDPIFGISPPLSAFPAGTVNHRLTTETNAGAYVSDAITLSENWKGMLGLRYTSDEQNGKEIKTPPLTNASKSASDTLPMVGLLYQPNQQWTVYASYTTSFVAASPTAQDVTGANPFQPTTAKQYETGVKADLWDNRVTSTVALFDIQKSNTLAVAACNTGVGGTCSQQVGGEESKGAEWEVNARPTDNWQIAFGFAHADATISQSNSNKTSPLVGARLTNAPLNSAHIWQRYDFNEGALRNLGVGLGIYYVSDHTGSLPSIADPRVLVLPSYVVTDFALYYKFLDRCTLTFKIGNVFNKTYYEGVNSTTNELGVVPGAPRNVELAVRIPFL